MEPYIIARALHILGVVLWIGGVAMVTTVLLPAVKQIADAKEQINLFEKIENKFSWQARFTTLLTGISGFYMLSVLNAWDRYSQFEYWWIHAMTIVWLLFTLILFILEPLVLHQLFLKQAQKQPEKTFKLIHRMHYILLTISLITILGAVAGSHGYQFT